MHPLEEAMLGCDMDGEGLGGRRAHLCFLLGSGWVRLCASQMPFLPDPVSEVPSCVWLLSVSGSLAGPLLRSCFQGPWLLCEPPHRPLVVK